MRAKCQSAASARGKPSPCYLQTTCALVWACLDDLVQLILPSGIRDSALADHVKDLGEQNPQGKTAAGSEPQCCG